MILINEKNIRTYSGEIVYRRGLDLYLRNKIRIFEIEETSSPSNDSNVGYSSIRITSLVESSSGYGNYNVIIEIDSSEYITYLSCDCPYSKAFNTDFCKHIVAVLIKFCREKNILLEKAGILREKSYSKFIDAVKLGINTTTFVKEKLNLNVKFVLENSYNLKTSLELKVGKDKMYVVKNIKEFLTSLITNSVIGYGKSFTLYPSKQEFNIEDSKIIEFLMDIFEVNQTIENDYNYPNNCNLFLSGKKAYLTKAQIKKILLLLEGRLFCLEIFGDVYDNIQIFNDDLPLDFSIDCDSKNVIIKQLNNKAIPLTKDGDYFFYDGNIYKPSQEQITIYSPFYNSLSKDNKTQSISISKQFGDQIGSYIIPAVKKISKSISIDDSIKDSFYDVPFKSQLYLDKVENNIFADLQFIYNDIVINPLNESLINNNKGILIRDVVSETKIINTLLGYNFVKSAEHFTLSDEENIVEFVSKGVLELQQLTQIYYSEEFKQIKVYSNSNFKSNIILNDNNLLEFNFQIEGIDNKELKEILASVREKKKYYRLKNGGFLPLDSEEINSAADFFDYLGVKDTDLSKDKLILSKFNALYIDESLKHNNLGFVQKNKRFVELIDNIKKIKDSDFIIPPKLENVLRGYQKVGFKWFKTLYACGFGGILADEMGLGKTVQAIAFIESEIDNIRKNNKPVLVISPSSLIYNWKEEFDKFSPDIKISVIAGPRDERDVFISDIENYDVIITSYPLIRRDIEQYKNTNFSFCIIDEAQQIKNPNSINARSVKEIKADAYFALTGTPIENSLTELWSIFDFLMPGYLLNHNKFVKKYELPIVKDKNIKALEELTLHIKPFILRRYKKDVVKELPPKIEHKLSIDMTDEQKKLYAAYAESAKKEIVTEVQNSGFKKSKFKILSLLTRLRQICCDPSVFIENYKGDSGKLIALDELLENNINEGHKILLFSQFTSVLNNIKIRLNKNNIDYMYLDGQTPIKDRMGLVNEFNNSECPIFLISLKAGGTGLNLTGADTVIHFDPWWNPAVEDQAVDRAHRIGQTKSVEVIKLLSRGTIEERIYELQEKKKNIVSSVLDEDNKDVFLSSMSMEEIETLFK